MKKNTLQDLFNDYLKRLKVTARRIGISEIIFREVLESREATADLRTTAEAAKLLNYITPKSRLILCDERGKNIDSREFAAQVNNFIEDAPSEIVFAVGGPDGFAENLRNRADLLLSFGRMSWAHQLVRVMLVEQLYRASTILLNHPYHRD